ncbi:NAD(P)/FAD-dependent oxidoreductase [Salinimicrobium oceani]|uniref:FAD-dependent oxidoreductase n=1 Tax=Salinimicrobium oceani TaxID=2722702 RepID=A0ABX1CXV8_9FLAO|nr:NAD(P)/FAD-dependent oxidoreductase [Salinimicrobium oceani]NJW53106.1 FAD-dependent oxidoreductase [Salinimicrobium oceani]
MSSPEHVVIIGNGVAGITAARHIRRISDKKITVISAESDYFFSRTALMYVYMGHMKWEHLKPYEDWFWKENHIELKKAFVEKIEPASKKLFLKGEETMSFDKLILATGSVPRFLGWEGEDLNGVQGLVSKQDLELLEENTRNCKSAVIVGGGLIGVELAEMLHTRNIPVTMLIREKAFWQNVLPLQDAKFISRHIESHGIVLKHETELKKINGKKGRVSSIETSSGEKIDCDVLGISVGVRPNIAFLEGSGIETDAGILVNPYLQTNVQDIYAIGDCAQHREPVRGRKTIEAVWYTARMMGETVAQTICGKPFRYKPGHWFNSAKFFDVEYQTYGKVSANPEEDEQHFHWENRKGERALTIAFDPESSRFLGINTFGIRMRHEVFNRWLKEERDLEFVLKNLRRANFDPEFYDRHEKEIFSSFKQSV